MVHVGWVVYIWPRVKLTYQKTTLQVSSASTWTSSLYFVSHAGVEQPHVNRLLKCLRSQRNAGEWSTGRESLKEPMAPKKWAATKANCETFGWFRCTNPSHGHSMQTGEGEAGQEFHTPDFSLGANPCCCCVLTCWSWSWHKSQQTPRGPYCEQTPALSIGRIPCQTP